MHPLIRALPLLLLGFSAAAADDATELQNLNTALNMLNQQQQAIYQQFQMVQELRRSSVPRFYGYPHRIGQVTDYEEAVQAQKNALLREQNLARQADRLLTEYDDIEAQKKPLRQRILELSLTR